jgi:hypothetical protein
MKVYLRPPAHMSLAMFRVASALELTMPKDWTAVATEDEADLLVLHVIGPEAVGYRLDKRCAVLQYCTCRDQPAFRPLWARAAATWSYYDLRAAMPASARFYHAPLGAADIFRDPFIEGRREIGCLTSGYVHGDEAEAILEPTQACAANGLRSVHLGPQPVGINEPITITGLGPITDATLARIYRQCRYVSGLRHVEGFELPALEGLCCGARPIMFDRPDDRRWFGDHAVFVPECSGPALYEMLRRVIAVLPSPVTSHERIAVIKKFDWDTLGQGFWRMVQEGL